MIVSLDLKFDLCLGQRSFLKLLRLTISVVFFEKSAAVFN